MTLACYGALEIVGIIIIIIIIIKDIDELRASILTAWDEMDQRIIDAAIKQWRWRTRLRTYIKAKGGHFEHTLSQ